MAGRSPSRQLDRIVQDLVNAYRNVSSSKELRAMGNFAIAMIQKRTRAGKGVSKPGGVARNLKRLRPRYIDFRKKHRDKLDSTTRPSKSNLTFSGQLLKSMKVRISGVGQIELGPTGSRKQVTGKKRRKQPSNENVAKWVDENGRPFMNLASTELRTLTQFYRKRFENILRSKGLT